MEARYIDAADTAKLIRKHLRRTFPGIKFSVRTDRYAGGAAVRISWEDGPTDAQVRVATRAYAGKGFDGSIDMEYHYSAWLEPNGTAVLAETSGTEGSRGSTPSYLGAPPSEAAELVYFGAGYVTTSRTQTDELEERVARFARPSVLGGGPERCGGACCDATLEEGATIYPFTEHSGYSWYACSPECWAQVEARRTDERDLVEWENLAEMLGAEFEDAAA